MGFFRKFERVESVVNHGYARWGKWIWGSLLAMILASGGWLFWAAIWGPPTGGVTLIIHIEIDRLILGFIMNEAAGPNASAFKKSVFRRGRSCHMLRQHFGEDC